MPYLAALCGHPLPSSIPLQQHSVSMVLSGAPTECVHYQQGAVRPPQSLTASNGATPMIGFPLAPGISDPRTKSLAFTVEPQSPPHRLTIPPHPPRPRTAMWKNHLLVPWHIFRDTTFFFFHRRGLHQNQLNIRSFHAHWHVHCSPVC